MATPTADTYTIPTGRIAMQAGRGTPYVGTPAWRTAMPPHTWAVVPVSNSLASVNPALDASVNPSGAGINSPWHGNIGHRGIIDAWGGFVPSQDDGRVWMPLGGGHADYAGNEAYVIDFMAEAPRWRRISKPTGAIGGPPPPYYTPLIDKFRYPDGRLAADHIYNNVIHIPGRGLFFGQCGGAAYPGEPYPDTKQTYWIGMEDGAHTLFNDWTAARGNEASGNGLAGVCYDPLRNAVWVFGVNGVVRPFKIDMATGATVGVGVIDSWVGGHCKPIYVPGHDVIYLPGAAYRLNPATGARTIQSEIGSRAVGATTNGSEGTAWVPSLGGMAVWSAHSNTTAISLLTPPVSNPMTNPWTWSVLPLSNSNTVTPTAHNYNGVFGKFDYLPALKGFYCQANYADSMYFYATE